MTTYRHYSEGHGPFMCFSRPDLRSADKRDQARQAALDPELVHRKTVVAAKAPRRVYGEGGSVSYHPGMPALVMPLAGDGSVDSDRIPHQTAPDVRARAEAHLQQGVWTGDQTPEALSGYLGVILGRPVLVHTVWQYNNAASGAPLWTLFYDEVAA